MTSFFNEDETPRVYAVRLSVRASGQVRQEHDRLRVLAGPAVADAWEDGFMNAVAGLATMPERCILAPEDAVFPHETLRQLLYQRRRGGPTWRILFSVREADANDPPMVWVHRVRHGAQAPMTEWPPDEDDEM